jgi:hypothetical protein
MYERETSVSDVLKNLERMKKFITSLSKVANHCERIGIAARFLRFACLKN